MDGGPPLSGQTYRYALAKGHHTDAHLAYNQYGRLLPKLALDILRDQEPWCLHLGGDDLLNTFAVQEHAGFYIPLISKPHNTLVKHLQEQSSFFLQPVPFDAPPNLHAESATLHEWSMNLNRAMDELRVKHGIFAKGWVIVSCMDPHMIAENILATFGGPVVRNLRNKIVGVKVF